MRERMKGSDFNQIVKKNTTKSNDYFFHEVTQGKLFINSIEAISLLVMYLFCLLVFQNKFSEEIKPTKTDF